MIAVLFEAFLKEDKQQEYFDLAAQLKPELLKIGGFISIERFQSINNPSKLLSLSFWRDEESIMQWRNVELHRYAQKQGRASIFDNYHLRIATVIRDYRMNDRKEAPNDSKLIHNEEL